MSGEISQVNEIKSLRMTKQYHFPYDFANVSSKIFLNNNFFPLEEKLPLKKLRAAFAFVGT